jgi:predicted DNA-binding transcriptional regulator YafY
MRYAKADRVMQLALELQASRTGLTLEDIKARFQVGHRTAQRMRDAVVRLFPQTEEWIDDERRRRWRIPTVSISSLVTFTADELADLEVAARLLRRENQRTRAASVEGVVSKIKAALKADAIRKIEPDLEALLEAEGFALRPGPRPVIRAEVLTVLRRAVKESSQVYIRYRARQTGRRTGRAVHPYGFLFGSRHYLVAHCPGRQPNVRLFSLANIEGVRILNKPATRDPAFSIQKFAEQSFGVFQEEPQDIVWRFKPAAAASAKEYLFHPTQVMEEQHDGSLIVRFRAGGLREMAWHIYTWGGDLEVLAPPALLELCRYRSQRSD